MKTKFLTLSPLAASILLWSAGSIVQAQATDFLNQDTLTGDWGGYRTQLKNDGVTLSGEYVSETAGILHGGISNGTRYAQQVKIGATFDLSRMFDVEHAGTFQLTINDRRGKSASNDLVGNRLPMQEDYGGEYTRLSEFSYSNWLLTPKLTYKVGLMAMGNDFGGMPILSNFVNAGFDAHPLSLSGGSGWGNYPTAHFGGEVRYDFDSGWSIHTAIFDVNPRTNSASSKAFMPFTHGTTGAIIPVEAIYAYRGALPGLYKFGYYHDTSKVARIGNSNSRTKGRNGGYVLGDQTVWQSETLKSQNLHVFGQWTTADTQSSPFHHWYSTGLVLNGPFESRPKDSIAIGYGRAVYNKKSRDVDIDSLLGAGNYYAAGQAENLSMAEKLVELSYNVQATPWLSVRPSLQYDKDPGAFSSKKITDAWVAAVQVKIEL
ncbi:carbohydrate porin [Serratia sp. M24T3]|uniref:carbohydrate porin n=1 Tax=Serratia sp. M24T3 TaxID=932213 RepID=UPI00025B9198|nr:carbohydrate porin [Serratia sp. M24T3]EIC83483.1 carbohydrate-selective porin OprB [Serratia sp. M24T3]